MKKQNPTERFLEQIDEREVSLGQNEYITPPTGTYFAQIVPLTKLLVKPPEEVIPPKPKTIGERIADIIASVTRIFRPPEEPTVTTRPEVTITTAEKVAKIIEAARVKI